MSESPQSPVPPRPEDPAEPTTGAEKQPWSKGKKAGVIGGGCCGLLLLAFIGLLILGLVIGPSEDAEPSAAATTTAEEATEPEPEEATTEPAPVEEETTEPEPTEGATTEEEPVEEETTEPEPTEEATTEAQPAPADDSQAWADAVEETALMGSSDWQELCGGDYSLGICWISDVTADRVGTLDVTLQVTGNDAEAKQYAEGAANTIFSSAGFDHDDLEWVVVHNAEGVVIDQKKRSDFPYLD